MQAVDQIPASHSAWVLVQNLLPPRQQNEPMRKVGCALQITASEFVQMISCNLQDRAHVEL